MRGDTAGRCERVAEREGAAQHANEIEDARLYHLMQRLLANCLDSQAEDGEAGIGKVNYRARNISRLRMLEFSTAKY